MNTLLRADFGTNRKTRSSRQRVPFTSGSTPASKCWANKSSSAHWESSLSGRTVRNDRLKRLPWWSSWSGARQAVFASVNIHSGVLIPLNAEHGQTSMNINRLFDIYLYLLFRLIMFHLPLPSYHLYHPIAYIHLGQSRPHARTLTINHFHNFPHHRTPSPASFFRPTGPTDSPVPPPQGSAQRLRPRPSARPACSLALWPRSQRSTERVTTAGPAGVDEST